MNSQQHPKRSTTSATRSATLSNVNQEEESSHLIFTVADQHYASPIANITGLIREDDPSINLKKEKGAQWWRATIKDTDQDIAIISLRDQWEFPDKPLQSADQTRNSIILFEEDSIQFGILVDTCLNVTKSLSNTKGKLPLPSGIIGDRGLAFKTVINWDSNLVVSLDLAALVTTEMKTATRENIESDQRPNETF